uniref:Uncharacterized protein n=1 Tax=Romanomermis culicivorax TaxID=13658 RepID=A0A915LCK1_ROMCU
METDRDLIREYEALGGYLSSDLSDAEPMRAQPSYTPHYMHNDPLQEPATFRGDIGMQYIELFPYSFDSTNHINISQIANDIILILFYFWPSTIEEGRRVKADIQQHLQCLKVDDKLVKQIIRDSLNPSAKQRNETAHGTLVVQAPHGVATKKKRV